MSSFCCNILESMINTKNLKHKKNKHNPLNKYQPHLEKGDKVAHSWWTVKEVTMETKEKFSVAFWGEGCL